MTSHFSKSEWEKINTVFKQSAQDYHLPERRTDSVIIGSFNIRKLGAIKNRTPQSWDFLAAMLRQFDLIAIQEIMDDLTGFEHLLALLGSDYGMVVSDVTGATPGSSGNSERLGFLFNWKRIQRTALASDITFDRSDIANNLYDHRAQFSKAWTKHTKALHDRETKVKQNKKQGKKSPSKPPIELPRFVTFVRQPHCVSFRIKGRTTARPYEFLVVNAHLLYGTNKDERHWEFLALIEWLTLRAKYAQTLYHPNLLLLGDCNLDFDNVPNMRKDVDAYLKGLNKTVLRSKKAAQANFPMLSAHPKEGILRSALRQTQTYDQIGLFSNDPRLPKPEDNNAAGVSPGSYNYGVFNIANLLANALHGKPIDQITKAQQNVIYKKAEFDITDHMPVWMRLPLPQ